MSERIPAQVFPPGEYIREELETRGWTQGDLAAITGRPPQMISLLLKGNKIVTPETARDLAAAFGTSPQFWLNLDNAYRLWVLSQKNDAGKDKPGDVAEKAKLFEFAPVKDMVKRNWIPDATSAGELRDRLLEFFGTKSLDAESALPFAAKKSTSYGADTPEQRAWAARVRNLAPGVGAARFDPATYSAGLADLQTLVTHEADVRRVPKLLADLGVRLLIVEHLPRSRLDGGMFWLTEGNEKPVVAVTMRFDRIDNFWFTLAHECAHVLHGDRSSVDVNLVGEGAEASAEKPEAERRADEWAANFLLADDELDKFILRVSPLFSKKRIYQFANRVKVHPGIIVGQLQRRGKIHWSHNREMLVKVRDILTDAALTDGWGSCPTH